MQDMLVRLYDLPQEQSWMDTMAAQGIFLRRPLSAERSYCCEWVGRHFSELWANEMDTAFSRNPVSCWLAQRENSWLGFACYETTAPNFFGPTGVLETERGKGIGKALLLQALNSLKHMGYGYAIIGGVGPAEFYTKAVDAFLIPGSDPGMYKGLLKRNTMMPGL